MHPRFHTPAAAIIAQALWSGVLVLSGTSSQLVSYTGFAVVLFSGIAVAGLFVLRWRNPDEPRPFRSWGYPFAPGVFVLAARRRCWATRSGNVPVPALAGLAIIASGIPVYLWFSRRRAA